MKTMPMARRVLGNLTPVGGDLGFGVELGSGGGRLPTETQRDWHWITCGFWVLLGIRRSGLLGHCRQGFL